MKEKAQEVKRGRKVASKMRRNGENKVFKLLMGTGRNAISSKKKKTVRGSDAVTGEAPRWRLLERRKWGSPGELQ